MKKTDSKYALRLLWLLMICFCSMPSMGKAASTEISIPRWNLNEYPLPSDWQFIWDKEDSQMDYVSDLNDYPNVDETNYHKRWMMNSFAVLKQFYVDLYAPKTDWKEFTSKYADRVNANVKNYLKASYSLEHHGAEGYDWDMFKGNLPTSTIVDKISIYPVSENNNWLLIKINHIDSVRLLVYTTVDGEICGLINPYRQAAIDEIIAQKVKFLSDFYHQMYAGRQDEKALNKKCSDIFTLKVENLLKRSFRKKHSKGRGLDWGCFTEGLDGVSKECPKLQFSFEGGEWYAVKTATGQPTGLQIRVEFTDRMIISGLRKVTPMQTKI